MDELYGHVRLDLPKLPTDLALHQPDKARAAMRMLMRAYDQHEPIAGSVVQPGDWIIVGPRGGGPNHVLIAGSRPNTLWHALKPRVAWTGMSAHDSRSELVAIYRMGDRHTWNHT